MLEEEKIPGSHCFDSNWNILLLFYYFIAYKKYLLSHVLHKIYKRVIFMRA
jgi:hypothetical protein